ncbi:MAG TPA: hypothetical protein VGJ22_04590 [Anaerolineales bacterium]|jgi:hypothetical protein
MREIRTVDGQVYEKRLSLFVLIIVALTVQWLLSFLGQSIAARLLQTGGFIYMLSLLIVVLIPVRFVS